MADKRVNVLVYSGMSFLLVCVMRILIFRHQAMVLLSNLSVTVSGLCAGFSVQTMLSSQLLESLSLRSHGLHPVPFSSCRVVQM